VARNLIVRGFDDKVHTQLGEMANQRGVSINSIVKDAVDKWLKHQQSQIVKKHHLVIYPDDNSMMELLKSMDRIAKEGDLFRCFCGPPGTKPSELLTNLKWYDATIEPYYYSTDNATIAESINHNDKERPTKIRQKHQQIQSQTQSQKNIIKYFGSIIENIAKGADDKRICCLDFLINDVAKDSLKYALSIEEAYNTNRIAGLTYCSYKTTTLLNSGIKNMLEVFKLHDQVFLLDGDQVHKLHVTKENVHKLFLN